MCMIVACHMLSYYKSELALWLNVGVQIFFIISGFLYGSKDILSPIDFIKRSFLKILIPYWLFLAIAVVLYAFLCPDHLTPISIVKALTCSGTIDGLGHLWFVGYILFCYFLTPYLYSLKQYIKGFSNIKTIFIYCGVLLAIQVIGYMFHSYFAPDRVSCYVLGYFVADLFERFSAKQSSILKTLLILIAVLMNGAEVFVKYYSDISFAGWQDTVFRALCHYSHMFLGIAIFLLFYGRFRGYKYCGLLRFSDQYSYPIYIVHQLFILSPLNMMSITDVNVINCLIIVILIILSGILLFYISKWLNDTIMIHSIQTI